MNDDIKSILKALLKAIIVIACIFIIGIICIYALLIWAISGTQYDSFNVERIAKMEETFKITVTDDIKLESYSENVSWDDEQGLCPMHPASL